MLKLYSSIMIFFMVTVMSLIPLAFAQGIDQTVDTLISFEVVQDQFPFNFKNIKSATIEEQNGIYRGLRIELKPYAIESFKRITTAGVGKVAILVINNKIVSRATIQTPLGGDILITSITRGEAQDIINKLKQYQTQSQN